MNPKFKLVTAERFETQAVKLPEAVLKQLDSKLKFLENNPRHPSLQTHAVKYAFGDFGGPIFEAYINDKYRITWEYGPEKNEITLRNVDNHDDCLKHP